MVSPVLCNIYITDGMMSLLQVNHLSGDKDTKITITHDKVSFQKFLFLLFTPKYICV